MGKKPVLKKSVTGIRIFSYSVFTFVIIAGLTLAVNITFFYPSCTAVSSGYAKVY